MDRFERAGIAFADLCRTMATLRAPDGCPWDREQTFKTLKTYLLEETYETLDAIDKEDPTEHCEELGDLVLQVVFQSEIAQETDLFDAAGVCEGIRAKLIRRHPHIFADGAAETAEDVVRTWEEIKSQERKSKKKSGLLDSIPVHLPALLRAYRTGEKASGVGFDWEDAAGPLAKLKEEWLELEEAQSEGHGEGAVREEFGDILFSMVNYSRHIGVDPEDALRAAIEKFNQRFRYVEGQAATTEQTLRELGIDRLNELWEEAKRQEGPPGLESGKNIELSRP